MLSKLGSVTTTSTTTNPLYDSWSFSKVSLTDSLTSSFDSVKCMYSLTVGVFQPHTEAPVPTPSYNYLADAMMLVSFNDLTMQKQAQAAILEAEKEKQSNEAKSRFLANMSHEIRTPLVCICLSRAV